MARGGYIPCLVAIRGSAPQNGHSIETVSLNPRNSPETRRRLSSRQQTGIGVMMIIVALLICCSATVFLAHAVDAYQTR
jgi:hypothetical protein